VSFSARLTLSIVLALVGVAILVIVLILQLDGGPSWLHFLTWVGGALFAFGVGSIISTVRYPGGMLKEGAPKNL
jgi:hypothetical protein